MRSSAASVHDCLRPGRTEGLNSLKNQPAWSGASREVTCGARAPSFAAASQPGLDADHVTQPARRHRQGSGRHCEPRPHPDHAAPSFSCPCSARGRAASRQHLLGLDGWSGDVLLDALTEGPTGRWGQVARARVLDPGSCKVDSGRARGVMTRLACTAPLAPSWNVSRGGVCTRFVMSGHSATTSAFLQPSPVGRSLGDGHARTLSYLPASGGQGARSVTVGPTTAPNYRATDSTHHGHNVCLSVMPLPISSGNVT